MNLFLIGNVVKYDGELWKIAKFYVHEHNGHTLYALVNCKTSLRKVVDETEIEAIEE